VTVVEYKSHAAAPPMALLFLLRGKDGVTLKDFSSCSDYDTMKERL
jgi:hypothetical protein